MRQINRLMYSRGLFKHLDYSAHGKTFDQGGVILIEVELYTDCALALEEEICNLAIDFGDYNSNVSTETARIAAEEPQKLYIQDASKTLEALNQLDQDPWQHIDEVTQLMAQNTRKQFSPLRLVDEPSAKPLSLSVVLTLDDNFVHKYPHLAPLFNVISRIMMFSIGDTYSAHFGFYGSHLKGKLKPLSMTYTLTITPSSAKFITVDQLASSGSEVVNYVLSTAMISRLIRALQATDYRNDVLLGQDITTIFEETGVLTGSAGWRSIATYNNIEQVINHTTLTLTFKRQKASLTLTL